MSPRILLVATNVDRYADTEHRTGLWLSELTHAWDVFAEHGFEQTIVSPAGGPVPLEPRSLKFPNFDRSAKAWHRDRAKMDLLNDTVSPEEVDASEFDAIYFTGGHAVMYDFTNNAGLTRITRELWEQDKVVASVCHGYCGLLNVTLSDGTFLVDGKRLTGFAWQEEVLARVDKLVPYNAQEVAVERGAHYEKGAIPFASFTVTDGKLVTGQNPGSARATARAVAALI